MSLSDANTRQATVPEQARWFSDEVYRHDAALRSYLRSSFPAIRENLDDVVQESYLRIWRARAAHPIGSGRGFLFRVARNVALDLVRRIGASPIDQISCVDELSVVLEGPCAAEAAARQERIRILAEAIASLPGRCREVFLMHKIQGYSRKEVAAKLGLSERTVGVQTSRASKRCAAFLRRRGVNGWYEDDV